MGWEKSALDLAELAGITTPARRLVRVDGQPVLLLDRFDREPDAARIGYISHDPRRSQAPSCVARGGTTPTPDESTASGRTARP